MKVPPRPFAFRVNDRGWDGGNVLRRSKRRMVPGVTIVIPRPTSGTIDGAPNIQTPSQAEHGLEGVFVLSRVVGFESGRKSTEREGSCDLPCIININLIF